jgi:hypothetical protein
VNACKGVDPLTYLQAQRYVAVCRSIEGDHLGALSHLNQLEPALQAFRRVYPTEFLDQLNSRAVELGQLGRVEEARKLLRVALASPIAVNYPTWHDTNRELDEIEAKGVKAPPLVFAIGSVFESASQLERDSRAEVSTRTAAHPVPHTVPVPQAVAAPETVPAQEAEPLAQPRPARYRAIAYSYKREAIPLAAIPLVKLVLRCAPLRPPGTSEKCSTYRSRPRAAHTFRRYIRCKPARAPPIRILP